MRTIAFVVTPIPVFTALLLTMCACSQPTPPVQSVEREIVPTISYETLAANIDRGNIQAYEGKHLRIRGHIRSYLDLKTGPAIALGEKLPSAKYPTILCVLSPSDANASQFRGDETGNGIHDSAFPDRLVTVDMLFTGRISKMDVYGGKNCVVE